KNEQKRSNYLFRRQTVRSTRTGFSRTAILATYVSRTQSRRRSQFLASRRSHQLRCQHSVFLHAASCSPGRPAHFLVLDAFLCLYFLRPLKFLSRAVGSDS